MRELSNVEIQNIIKVSQAAEVKSELRELSNSEIKDLLIVAEDAEKAMIEPAPSSLDSFLSLSINQVWLGEKLAELWQAFPIASLFFVVIVSVLN